MSGSRTSGSLSKVILCYKNRGLKRFLRFFVISKRFFCLFLGVLGGLFFLTCALLLLLLLLLVLLLVAKFGSSGFLPSSPSFPRENLFSINVWETTWNGSSTHPSSRHPRPSERWPTARNSEKKGTKKIATNPIFVRVGFWQNRFFADFYFWAAVFFRGFSRRIFSPHFVGKMPNKNPPGKSPGKFSEIYTTKILRRSSAERLGQYIFWHHFSPFHCAD